jgi:CRP-like cAMP-binding protein
LRGIPDARLHEEEYKDHIMVAVAHHNELMSSAKPVRHPAYDLLRLNPLITRLRRGATLSADDCSAIIDATTPSRSIKSGVNLAWSVARTDGLLVVLDGVVAHYKDFLNGNRQILALMLPGDVCWLDRARPFGRDQGLSTLSPTKLAMISRQDALAWQDRSAAIREALERAALVDQAILREWLVNVGGRPALTRTAHLFCELGTRLKVAGVISDVREFDSGLTQAELGQALGLSVVHVNRMLRQLKARQLTFVRSGRVRIPDFDRLAAFAEFNSSYLHPERLCR